MMDTTSEFQTGCKIITWTEKRYKFQLLSPPSSLLATDRGFKAQALLASSSNASAPTMSSSFLSLVFDSFSPYPLSSSSSFLIRVSIASSWSSSESVQ